jgi:hypothetical protein
MAAIGNSPTQQAFTPAIDYFSGNGSTTAFTLSRPVASVAQVQVTIDNVAQNPSSAYTVSANTITFTSAPLSGTNNIYVYYTSPITQVIAPGQGTVGTTALATSPTITTPTLVTPNITTGLLLTSAAGTSGQFLTSAGSGSAPTWTTVASSQWTTSGANIYYATGSVGIGTTSPFSTAGATTLSIGGTSSSTTGQIFLRDASGNNTIQIYRSGGGYNEFDSQSELHLRTESGAMRFSTANTEVMRIDTSGNIITGNTSVSSINGGGGGSAFWNSGTNNIRRLQIGSNSTGSSQLTSWNTPNGEVGSIVVSGVSTTYNTSSDYRLKENIVPMTGALAKVSQLKPCTYKWKWNGSDGEGFIAHELAEVCPSAVSGEKDAIETYLDEEGNEQTRIKPQGIDTSFLVATLTAAIQELKAINDTLTARIEALENR